MFYLPEKYPIDRCPWHIVPNANVKTKIAVTGGALALLGAGYGASVVKDKWEARKQNRKTEESQREWREKAEARRNSQEDNSTANNEPDDTMSEAT